ncbi:MAG: hypothetical protein KAI17_02690, partial [Thiotrichaceae bacterium]|nr:hypothetical protein [Thiotrichaceae bacterium]
MTESVENITLQTLQKASYKMALPVQIKIKQSVLQCNELLRIVPAKRLVFSGMLFNERTNEKVIIKLFVHSTKAKKHWQRECAGAKLLTDNNVLTPEIRAQGISDEGIYYLIFPYIEGQNLAQFWQACSQEHSQTKREKKLKDLMPVLEKHHSAGLAHQDLHYANFLLADAVVENQQAIYTLDGEEVKAHAAPLNKVTRLKNLALFLAQTFDLSQSASCSLLNDYIALTSLQLKKQQYEQFWQWIKAYQQQRIDHYLKKMVRECTDVIYETKKQAYTLCRREYYSSALQELLDQPEQFFQDKNSVYLKQGNTCTVKSVLVDNQRYVVKRYNPKGLTYELKHKGQNSRAKKSWLNAHL